jgi:hypothetical protein
MSVADSQSAAGMFFDILAAKAAKAAPAKAAPTAKLHLVPGAKPLTSDDYKLFKEALKETPAGRWKARKIHANGEMKEHLFPRRESPKVSSSRCGFVVKRGAAAGGGVVSRSRSAGHMCDLRDAKLLMMSCVVVDVYAIGKMRLFSCDTMRQNNPPNASFLPALQCLAA